MQLTGDLIKRRTLLPAPSNDGPYSWLINLRRHEPFADASSMTAAEQMFFLGAPVAHVIAYQENLVATRAQHHAPAFARQR